MKKLIITAMVTVLCSSIFFGCSSKSDEKIENSNETKENTFMDNLDFNVPAEFAASDSSTEYGQMKVIEYYSETTGTTRKANVLLPAGYTTDKEYPVLYLLHGIGGDQNEWNGGNPKTIIGNLIASGEAEEMIVVIPNVRARANDKANPSDIYTVEHFKAFDNFINDLTNDLMPYINENYSTADGRENTAIAGLSMGGREALYIGFTLPETFGYIGAFCPAPGVLPYNVESGLFTNESFTLPDEYQSSVMIVAGKTDTVVGNWPETYHKTLENNGVEHIYYVTDGGHDFVVWKNGLYNFAKRIFH